MKEIVSEILFSRVPRMLKILFTGQDIEAEPKEQRRVQGPLPPSKAEQILLDARRDRAARQAAKKSEP